MFKDQFYKIVDLCLKAVPIHKQQVMFYSCLNQYNDNPKYVAQALYEKASNIKFVWVKGSLSSKDIPPYFKIVRHNSLKYYYEKNRSMVIVENGLGVYTRYPKGIKKKLFPLLKRKNQINISTWHGTPLKHIGSDEASFSKKLKIEDYVTTSDLLIVGNGYEENILKKITNNTVKVLPVGNPRNDILFDNSTQTKFRLRGKLELPKNKKLVLFAPTYRENIGFDLSNQIQRLNTEKLCKCLADKFGGEWMLVLRLHQITLQTLQANGDNLFDHRTLNGNKSSDMSEYLLACDALITDYSGSIFDISLTKKPCFLYAPDYDTYCKSRGLYMLPKEFPYSISKNFEELYENIGHYNTEEINFNIEKFHSEIRNYNTGNASEETAKYILRYLNSKKE